MKLIYKRRTTLDLIDEAISIAASDYARNLKEPLIAIELNDSEWREFCSEMRQRKAMPARDPKAEKDIIAWPDYRGAQIYLRDTEQHP
jgi:hypothetical protein